MSYYDLTSFCNTIFYFPPNDVTLSVTEDAEQSGIETTLTEAVKKALENAEKIPNTTQQIQEGIQKLNDKERNNIISTTDFNLKTDDVAIIALLTAFLAVINGPGGAITFGAFLAIVAGLNSKYSETAQGLLEKIPSPNPQDTQAKTLVEEKQLTAVV